MLRSMQLWVLGCVRAECNAGGGSWAAPDQAEGQAAGRGAEHARGAPKSGRKRALQLRLRAMIIAAAAAVAGEE
jgi:hypothetical protein